MEKKLSAQEALEKLARMRNAKLTAQEMLETLAEIRKSVPGTDDAPRPHHGHDGRSLLPYGIPAETEQDFEDAAVIDALQLLIDDIETMLERKRTQSS